MREKQKANDLAFNLWPTGVISGRVLDSDGEGVAQAQVRAYALLYREAGVKLTPAGAAQSDDRGEYRIYGLAAGKYLIGVRPPQQDTPAGEYYANTAGVFYPATLAPENALPLKVSWGQDLASIDLELSEKMSYSITGGVFDAETGGPCAGCVVRPMRLGRSFWLTLSKQPRTSREGRFVISGLAAGTYKIFAQRPGVEDVVTQRTIEVSDRNVADVGLMAGRGVPVGGKVVLEGDPEISGASDMAVLLSSLRLPLSWPQPEAPLRDDLTFQVEAVPPETYFFEVLGLPAGSYLKTLGIGGRPLNGPELTISDDAPLTGVQAVIAFDAATVSGQVKPRRSGRGEDDPIEARVALIPKPNQGGYVRTQTVQTTPDGGFSFATVVPGAYTLYALPAMSSAQLMDPAVQASLRSYTRQLDLEPSESATVELPLGPDSE